MTVQPLREVRSPATSNGRVWVVEGSTIALTPHGDVGDALPVFSHLAFRITALTLDSAADGSIFLTGGKRTRPRS